ncbi:MAG: hypothetical protein ABJH28_09235 [Paraglaciecola sp.]|uniref:hypothetical protein n=1 Tax=Paraglaciecola sp. TaxID=1920173 RepID=UPI00326650DF
MNFKVIFAGLFFSILFATNVNAGCNHQRCTGSVSNIYISEGGTYIAVDQDMTSLNCTLSSGRMTLRNSHANRDAVLSLLLAAQATGRDDVQIRISENTSDCKINYVISG